MKKVVPILGIIGGATAIFWWGLLGWVESSGWSDKIGREKEEQLKIIIRDAVRNELLETKTGGVVRAK